MDLFVVPTIDFNLLYAFVIVRLNRRGELVGVHRAFGVGHRRTSPSLRFRAFISARESSIAVISSAPICFLLAIALASSRSGTATMHSIARHALRA